MPIFNNIPFLEVGESTPTPFTISCKSGSFTSYRLHLNVYLIYLSEHTTYNMVFGDNIEIRTVAGSNIVAYKL